MRTLELIKTLSEKELRQLRSVLGGKKRKSLLVLFEKLQKFRGEEEPENKELYEAVFKKRYTKAKDYLLRNELRLLNEEIYRILVLSTFEKHLDESNGAYEYWLSRAFYDRKSKALFLPTASEGIAKAEGHIANQLTTWPVYSAPLQSMKGLWLTDNVAKTESSITEQIKLVDEWMTETKRRFVYTVMEGYARGEYLQMNLARVLSKPPRESDPDDERLFSVDLKKILNADWYAAYLDLKRRMYQTKGGSRIELLTKMSEMQTRPDFIKTFGYNPEIVNHGNLGIEYIMQGNAENAAHHFKLAMELNEKHGTIENIAHTQNYVVTLIVQGKYHDAIAVYQRYEEGIKRSRAADLMQIYKAFAYLFLDDPDSALAALPSPSQTMIYPNMVKMRCVYLIAFIQRGEYKLAANELANLKRFIKQNTSPDGQQLEIAELFQQYLNEQLKEAKPVKSDRVADKILAQKKKYTHWALIDLHLCWLMKRLKVS